MRFGVVGIEHNGAAKAVHRSLKIARLLQRGAKTVVARGIIWPDLDRPARTGNRFLQSALQLKHGSQAAQGLGEVGANRERLLVASCRVVHSFQRFEHVAQDR